jgi:hypothetical protein
MDEFVTEQTKNRARIDLARHRGADDLYSAVGAGRGRRFLLAWVKQQRFVGSGVAAKAFAKKREPHLSNFQQSSDQWV